MVGRVGIAGISTVVACATVTLCAFAGLVTFVAVLTIMLVEAARNVHEEGTLLVMAAWDVMPCAFLGALAWRARNKRAASIVAFVGSLVVISPQILLMWAIIASRGGDAQSGLGLLVIPLIQCVVVALEGLVVSLC